MGESTAALLGRLQRHYIKPGENLPGGVFLPEVGWNGGGFRRCDALYVGFTTTSGRILVGHELKVSRADWLHELDDAGKSDEWADQCHEWWLVVSDPAIVGDGELPAGWGLMAPGRSKTRMQVLTAADRKPSTHRPSWNAARSILARQDTLRAQAISADRQGAYERAHAACEPRIEGEVARRLGFQPEVAELDRKLKQIEEAIGGRIDWEAEERGYILPARDCIGLDDLRLIADAVRGSGRVREAVQRLTDGYDNPVKRTRGAIDQLAKALDELRDAPHSKEANHGA